MNVLIISTSYFESSICENADILLGIEIDCLFMFKDNHKTNNYRSHYKISLVSSIDEIPKDCKVYIIPPKDFPNDLIINVLDKCRNQKMEVYLAVPIGYKNSKVMKYNINYIFFNTDSEYFNYQSKTIKFTKPVILICGLSSYNQQISLELKLKSLFQRDGINCYFVSHYQNNNDNHIQNLRIFKDNRSIKQWLFSISQKVESAELVCISLPFDIQNRNIYGYGSVELIFDIVNPNYTICCISRDKELLHGIRNIEIKFSNKFGRDINSMFISDYESNKSISPDCSRPMKSFRPIKYKPKTKCRLYNKEIIEDLYKDMIDTLTIPEGVTIIQ